MGQNIASLNEIAHNLLNDLRGGRSSNTEHVSLNQIKYAIKYYRAMFIRRDEWRNLGDLRLFEQDLGIIPVTSTDSAEDASITSGFDVLRTAELPAPIRLKDRPGFTHVSDPDQFGEPYQMNDSSRVWWNQYSRYTGDEPMVTYLNGRIYLINDISEDNIRVRGVFEDPEEVFNFTRANGLTLYDEDSPFPISMDMLEGITKGLLNGELKLAAGTQSDDELNNLQDP